MKQEAPEERMIGLTEQQVNWANFSPRPLLRRKERERILGQTERFDFVRIASDILKQVTKRVDDYSRDEMDIKVDPALEGFVTENRPPTLFLSPKEIINLITPNSSIDVGTSGPGQWQFSLNPNEFKEFDDNFTPRKERYSMSLRNPDPKKADVGKPYLIVDFPAHFRDSKVVFFPHIADQETHSPGFQLEGALIKLLGLEEKAVDQELDFAIRKGLNLEKDSVEISLRKKGDENIETIRQVFRALLDPRF